MEAGVPASTLEVSAETLALERAIGNLAGLRPDMRVRTQVAWMATPGSAASKGRLWAIAELDRTLARSPEWTAGAKIDATLTAGDGTKLGATTLELASGQRSAGIDMPDVALPPGDVVLRMRITPAGGGLPLVESVRFAIPPAPSPVGSPRLWRRGPSTGTQFQRTGDAAYRRNEWLRIEVPLAAAAESVQAELLDRTGKVLKVPVNATLSPAEGDLSWAVADVALAPLAAADYAVRVKVVLAGATHETLLAFRIVP